MPRSSRKTYCQLREERMPNGLDSFYVTFVNNQFMHNSHAIDNDGRWKVEGNCPDAVPQSGTPYHSS